MHPHNPRVALRLVLMGLLIVALIVLFPIKVRSYGELVELALTVL